jgi:hypothetical protein
MLKVRPISMPSAEITSNEPTCRYQSGQLPEARFCTAITFRGFRRTATPRHIGIAPPCQISLPSPESRRRADISVQPVVTRPNHLREEFRERENRQSYQPFAGISGNAFGTGDACIASDSKFGASHDRYKFSSTMRAPVETTTRKEYRMDCGRSFDLAGALSQVSVRNTTLSSSQGISFTGHNNDVRKKPSR